MKRPDYREAIQWLAHNDDTEWVQSRGRDAWVSVAASLVADLFGVDGKRVRAAVRRELKKETA
jgi:hypothetical protein